MHHFNGKMGILRPKNGFDFKLMLSLAAFYRGPTQINQFFLKLVFVCTVFWFVLFKLVCYLYSVFQIPENC